MKRLLILMGVLGALAVGIFAVAAAGAQEDTPTPSPDAADVPEDDKPKPGEKFLDGLAENLGISREELDAAVDETQIDLIDQAVADGKIDEEKADELKERIANGEPLFPRFGFGDGPRPGHHRPHFQPLRWIVDNAAELLGLEKDTLIAELQDGKSLAELAEEQGLDLDGFKTDLLAAAKEDLDAKVAEGEITQERADKLYQMFEDNIDRIVNAKHDLEMGVDGDGVRERFRFQFGESGAVPFPEGFPEFPPAAIPDLEARFAPDA